MDLNQTLTSHRAECANALRCWYLTGATASGKSLIGIELAKRLNAEILSLDSMAIYREMDIATAKPTREQQAEVPHHLIDIISPAESFSVSKYREMALAKIAEIKSRGREVLFVGGSALYLKAMLRGLFEGPPADWKFREEIEEELERIGSTALHERLKILDPLSAHKLHVNDRRRLIRALEVFHLTGRPISHWQMEFDHAHRVDECRVFAIRHPRAVLHERIAQRVSWMFDNGLIPEVEQLLANHRNLSRTALQAVGYCEVIDYLQGRRTLDEAREQTLIRTRRFARHQETWFRGLSECEFVEVTPNDTPEVIADNILKRGQNRPHLAVFSG